MTPKRILAIDASGGACSAALWRRGVVVAQRYRRMARGHAEALIPMVVDVVAAAGERLRRLDAVAATVGPGAFTGIRIGLAAARGIGLAASIPTIGVTTFEAVAEAVPDAEWGDRMLIVVLDTKRGDVFVQRFSPARRPVGQSAIETVEALVSVLPTDPLVLAGDGVALVQPRLAARTGDLRYASVLGPVDAVHVASAAARSMLNDSARPAVPFYLRAPDVRLTTVADRSGRPRE